MSKVMRVLKANSSRWVREEGPHRGRFGWQTGYAAFSVSQSSVEPVREYILNQAEHHRRMTFQEEYLLFLRRHGIAYDERYVFE
jgi:putative transposase